MIKPRDTKIKKAKMDANTWLAKNFEDVVNKYGGKYVVIIDGKGVVFSGRSPLKLAERAKLKFPGAKPLFSRVPHPRDLLCAVIVR